MYLRTGFSGFGDTAGFSCNTQGGYSLVQPSCWMTPQCMTASDLAAANAACAGNPAPAPVIVSDPTTGGLILQTSPPAQTVTPSPIVANSAPSTTTTTTTNPTPAAAITSTNTLPVTSSLASTTTTDSFQSMLDSAVAWAQANPLYAGGIGLLVLVLLLRR